MAANEIILLIVICLVISGFIHWAGWSSLASFTEEGFPLLYTPGTLHSFTKMNWFGCIISWIVLLPFTFLLEIGGVIKWLFTVGRKD